MFDIQYQRGEPPKVPGVQDLAVVAVRAGVGLTPQRLHLVGVTVKPVAGLDPDVLEWASIDSNEACKPSKSRG
jgi:hypothetical protein